MSKSIALPATALALAAAWLVPVPYGRDAKAQTAAPSAAPFVNVVDLDINPASMTKFLAALRDDGAGTIKEDGAREFDATVAQKSPNHAFIFEVYDNSAAWDAHQKTATYAKFIGITMAMIKSYNIRGFAAAALNKNGAAQPASGPLLVNAEELDIAAGQIDAFLAAAKAHAAAAVQDPGCRAFNIAVSQMAANHVLFFEVYDTAAALDAQVASDHYKAYQAATKGMIAKSTATALSSVAMLDKGQ